MWLAVASCCGTSFSPHENRERDASLRQASATTKLCTRMDMRKTGVGSAAWAKQDRTAFGANTPEGDEGAVGSTNACVMLDSRIREGTAVFCVPML